MSAPLGTRRATLQRRIRLLVGATITYNVIEAVVALAEGTRVSSSALIGFGLDSVVEISSAAAVAWQFSATDPETREKAALRFIAMSFFALAAYVAADAVRSLLGFGEARPSLIGIVLAAASLVIMPVLSLRSAVPAVSWGRGPPSPIPSRPSCALISPRSCWQAWWSTACGDGRGPTPLPPSASPRLLCERA